ncbi:hypothetical protein AMAG_12332 [Allomyces macrogynus ATCC 38327]|uniref:tRNA (guanine(37)-N1)-methyltransferase n=1 Tax=Allomyces macrogynus (strain ATCC 38327) TaxID=578462 RepID=A0A0L0SXZ1_ALLM3|nr:hypothetical protein AMAG_12332 [Allomyces macrogynus ATCC 38327]|eukprot:KNE67265.1 hypothetical protein AMAG_12332 [Allomyces macrogynus ATCC 38327]
MAHPLRVPPLRRAMRELDRTQFARRVPLVALRVPAAKANKAMKALDSHLLNWPRLRNLIDDPNSPPKGTPPTKLMLLKADVTARADPAKVPTELPQVVKALSDLELPVEAVPYTLELGYEYWSADEILKAVLPEDAEVITAFEAVGDVAHMNLRSHLLPYKNLIGQVIVDKNLRINTVVNKTSSIHTQFRTFPLEILARRADVETNHTATHLPTTVSENGITFHLDFATVYWNSRLHTEHGRLVKRYFSGDRPALVADAMCGIGPFALPAAKSQLACVFANDLNPDSYKWLVHNIGTNAIPSDAPAPAATEPKDGEEKFFAMPPPAAGLVRPFNLCAREFVRASVAKLNDEYATVVRPACLAAAANEELRARTKERKHKDGAAHRATAERLRNAVAHWDALEVKTFEHYVMNLPASALGFLDAFHGLYAEHATTPALRTALAARRPLVHVYCFTRAQPSTPGETDDMACTRDVQARIEQVLGTPLDAPIAVHRVRLVAPRKHMCCASFTVPEKVVFGECVAGDIGRELNYDAHDEEELVEREDKRAREPVEGSSGASPVAKKARVDADAAE